MGKSPSSTENVNMTPKRRRLLPETPTSAMISRIDSPVKDAGNAWFHRPAPPGALCTNTYCGNRPAATGFHGSGPDGRLAGVPAEGTATSIANQHTLHMAEQYTIRQP